MPLRLDIHEDIRRAETPPGALYGDPAFHALARERVFARSWQLVADAESVRVPQQVHPFTFLEGCVDEPLLLARDGQDRLRCMSNTCTHRGALVAEAPCRTAHLRCPYHGRRWGLDGTFAHMPEFEETADFPRPEDDLRNVASETWGPFVFAAIDPLMSFDALFGDVMRRIAWYPVDQLRLDPSRSRDYLVQANWALYCDNYLEGFHIPFVHTALNAVLDYGAYRTELFAWSNLQVGIAEGGGDFLVPPAGSPDGGQRIGGYYFWLFPNLMLNVYPWGISVNIVRPLAVDRTRISYLAYVADPARLDRGAGAELDRVEREDEAVVESVQHGLRSRLYSRGRYSPTREQGVHHFHRLLAAMYDD